VVVVVVVVVIVVVVVVVVAASVVVMVMNTETNSQFRNRNETNTTPKNTEVRLVLCRYLNVSLNSRVQHDLWNVMSALAKCQYPFYFRMQGHLEASSHILPQLAGFNVSHFMLQVYQSSLFYTGFLDLKFLCLCSL
jgi:hypothetical protein